ncbi:J domain-containing protein [Acetanaerobacterium elongatum]|uniref:DnaJ domain-containing protein n=1 Tax=Acetanaerobacterium elongatum TaxID=258515 RepID=A0A1H0FLR1_9FIRM|nr:J domain-containing protein [Acetanaerobacterium elongatum]SDN95586.1 DnaJ domain-containing protein [Acetanaerobacterium elongatum]
MTDPYKILGVSEAATDSEIKEAYRELAKKYHPDAYVNNPLSDLAEEKMKEINEAYDTIMNIRRNGGGYNNGASGYNGSTRSDYGASSQFADIRRMINNNRTIEAEELLDGIPIANRDAEWHFLKGSIQYKKGYLDDAYAHFSTACRLNPNNAEYASALNTLNYQRRGGTYTGPNGGYRTRTQPMVGCSPCDMCCGLMYADCCCECMGGDLIDCC